CLISCVCVLINMIQTKSKFNFSLFKTAIYLSIYPLCSSLFSLAWVAGGERFTILESSALLNCVFFCIKSRIFIFFLYLSFAKKFHKSTFFFFISFVLILLKFNISFTFICNL